MIGELARKKITEQCAKISIDYDISIQCRISGDDEPLGFLDTSRRRDGTRGIAFTKDMIYFRLDDNSVKIPYSSIRSVQIISSFEDFYADELSIKCDGLNLRVSDCSLDKSELKRLIDELCKDDSTYEQYHPPIKETKSDMETAIEEMKLAANSKSEKFIAAIGIVCAELNRAPQKKNAHKKNAKKPKSVSASKNVKHIIKPKNTTKKNKSIEEIKPENVTEIVKPAEEIKTETVPENIKPVAEIKPETVAENVKPAEEIKTETIPENIKPVAEIKPGTAAENVKPVEEIKTETIPESIKPIAEIKPETAAENIKPVKETKTETVPESFKPVAEIKPETAAENVKPVEETKTETVPESIKPVAEIKPETSAENVKSVEKIKSETAPEAWLIGKESPKSADEVIHQGVQKLPDHKSQAEKYAEMIAERLAEDALRGSGSKNTKDKIVPEDYSPTPIPEEGINWLNDSKKENEKPKRDEKKVHQMSGAPSEPNEAEEREKIQNMSREETLSYLAQSFNEINEIIPEETENLPFEEPQTEIGHINDFARSQAEYEVKKDTLTTEPLWGDIYIKASRSLREQCENGKLTMKQIENELNSNLLVSARMFMKVIADEKKIPKVLIPKITELKEAVDHSEQYFKLGEDIAVRAMFFMMYQMLSYSDRITESPETKAKLNDFFRTFGSAGIALSMLDMRV